MKIDKSRIRNFCIIAHIDHGKSTLADRFIELAGIVDDRNFKNQLLDSMDIERERGITIKSQAVTIPFTNSAGEKYILNLVDTPGHVDFSYEVSRAISSCEGALLLIDASQGVEAQTLANMYMAIEHDLEIIPVINKIDLASADIDFVKHQIDHELGLDPDIAVPVSAKTGLGVENLLESLVEYIPPPKGDTEKPLKALIFDSHYDPYRGVVIHIRIFEGRLSVGDQIKLFSNNANYKIEETGIFEIDLCKKNGLSAGEVGYIIAGIKTISDIRVGDTVTLNNNPCEEALTGFKDVKPVVFSSIYPIDADDYSELLSGIEKLKLNDASLVYEKDSSVALGFGFRCGFLGLLHLEVVQERLEREFNLSIIFTSPSVRYHITLNNGEELKIDNPLEYPDPMKIDFVEEPYIRASLLTPSEFVGNIINLCLQKRGVQQHMEYLDEKRVELIYEMPLAEVLFDFYDKLKSISRGYASFDYELQGFKRTDLVRLDILVNGEIVDALSQLVFRDSAVDRARTACKKLREEIPKQQFKIPIQGSIGSTIISRETISALRKDVTAKCYGGDISRKRKLLEKQKAGKKRMKMVGNVEVPQSAFLSILKSD
ncbi:MAG: translation elongation factor 4 [Spirochaetales bacterium]|nr:translation elongation factor 4 [Spirochaetales bacterium]